MGKSKKAIQGEIINSSTKSANWEDTTKKQVPADNISFFANFNFDRLKNNKNIATDNLFATNYGVLNLVAILFNQVMLSIEKEIKINGEVFNGTAFDDPRIDLIGKSWVKDAKPSRDAMLATVQMMDDWGISVDGLGILLEFNKQKEVNDFDVWLCTSDNSKLINAYQRNQMYTYGKMLEEQANLLIRLKASGNLGDDRELKYYDVIKKYSVIK